MTGPEEIRLLEEHLRDRIAALREDMRLMEARIDARITLNSTRLANLEGWQNQILGADKAGRIVLAAIASIGIGAFTLWIWIYEHFVRYR